MSRERPSLSGAVFLVASLLPRSRRDRIEQLRGSVSISRQAVLDLRRERPALLTSLASASTSLLSQQLIREPVNRATLLQGLDVLAGVVVGLLSGDEDDVAFVEGLFFGGDASKCASCGAAVLAAAWRVCPYCEKRLNKSQVDGSTLAARLGSTLVALAFVSDFTLQPPKKNWSGFEPYHDGVLTARERLINCMMSFVAPALLGTQAELSARKHNRWLDALMQAPQAGDLFSGLMNVGLVGVPSGWLSFSEDKREGLRKACLNLILVLLSGHIPSDKSYATAPGAELVDDRDRNLAVDYLRSVSCKFAVDAIVAMLRSTELFAYGCGLLWNLSQHNADFNDHVAQAANCARLVVPLLAFISSQKTEVKSHGTINLAIFILLSLSSRRSFGVALNLPLGSEGKLLPKSSIEKEANPTIADALFLVVESVIASGQVEALHECLLMMVCNVSPYQKTLSMTSSVALMRLFVLFSSRSSLLKTERSHDLLALVMDCISNMLQYQYEGNRPLTYAVVSYRERFYRLFDVITDKDFTVEQFREDRVPKQPFHTKEWFDGWRRALPARVIAKVLDEIVPLLEKIETNQAEVVIDCSKFAPV
jgi:hypothetical protein